jgi:hypothetical protein
MRNQRSAGLWFALGAFVLVASEYNAAAADNANDRLHQFLDRHLEGMPIAATELDFHPADTKPN